ncbi:hypothetical protein SLG_05080 [Sphingobium sp. SYK-6]|nr:NF038122 family metalloprotease [Sphingobium sp. SYK-6]BAK65183.1 hypothetical protein SLG_05080 [Sphingobium sp. SYK-6]
MRTSVAAILLASTLAAAPAQALTIDLFDMGGMAQGTAQYTAFRTAANYWEKLITTDTTVRIDTYFNAQGINGPIGGTSNYYYTANVSTVLNAMASVASGSAIDQTAIAHLPDASSGSIGMWTPAYTDPVAQTGADPFAKQWDNDGSNNNSTFGVTWALGKALGLVYVDSYKDGSINFNSDLSFDFDPTDGIDAGSYDFTFTAFHEIGHILGFTSGVDYYDAFAPSDGYHWDWDWIGHGTDIFRYSEDGLDWSLGGTPFFSIDGGETALLGGAFSTGANWGDGQQASHWKEGLGIMDPTAAKGEMGVLRALDLAMFDALGWNLSVDALADPDLRITTAAMFGPSAVPEPASWAMMIGGFALIGASLRRRTVRFGKMAPALA